MDGSVQIPDLRLQLGEPDSRNRRSRTPFATRARLLALDYVLARSTLRFLATEHERVTFFSERLGVSRTELPTRFGRPDGGTVPRYFRNGYTVGVSEDEEIVFALIDDGVSSVLAFDTYLAHHRALLVSLQQPGRVTYIASGRRNFHGAGVVRRNSRQLPIDVGDFSSPLRR